MRAHLCTATQNTNVNKLAFELDADKLDKMLKDADPKFRVGFLVCPAIYLVLSH